MIRRIGRSGWNLLVSSAAEAATRVLGTVAVILLARYLQPAGFGAYSTVLAYYALAASLGGLGLDRLTLRELSTADPTAPPKLGTLLGLRTGASVVLAAGGMGLGLLLKPDWLPLLAIAAAALVPASIGSTYAAVFQGRERFGVPAGAAVAAAAAVAAFILFGIATDAPLPFFLWALVIGELFRAGWLVIAAHRQTLTLGRFDPVFARKALRGSLPYGVLAILGTIYFRIDLVMLEAMAGVEATGEYASAYRILEIAAVLPALILGVLFPRFARLLDEDPDRARKLYLYATRTLLWIGAVGGVIGIAVSAPLIELIYTDRYASAASALRWLMLALIFLFAHASNVTVLFASTRLRSVVKLSFITVAANMIANLMLIPRFGPAGAAAATAGSELLSLAIFTPMVCRRLGISAGTYLRSVCQPISGRDEMDILLGRADDRPTLATAPE